MFPEKLQQTAIAEAGDEKPNLISFIFAGLEGLADKYGRDSDEVRAAAAVLDTCVEMVWESLC